MAKSKLAKYKSRRRKSNPSASVELAASIGAGFAGYGVSRGISHIVTLQVAKRWPKATKIAHIAATAAGAAGVYFGTKHIRQLEGYHDAAVIGAGVALAQVVAQTLAPAKYAWLISDPQIDVEVQRKKAMRASQSNAVLPAAPEMDEIDMLIAESSNTAPIPVGHIPELELGTEPMPAIDDDDIGGDLIEFPMDADDLDLEAFSGLPN